jgi:Flp pilus assembly protein TadG
MAQVSSMAGRLKSERGAELIEMALVLPLLLLIIVGTVDFGFLFQRYEVLTNAAREGARIAVLPGYNTADVRSRVCSYLTTGGVPTTGCTGTTPTPTNPVITVTDPVIAVAAGTPLNAKQVQLVYTHNFMFIGPIMGLMGGAWTNAKTVTIIAVMRKET